MHWKWPSEEEPVTSHAEKNGKWPVIHKFALYVASIYFYLFTEAFNSK